MERIREILVAIDSARYKLVDAIHTEQFETQKDLLSQLSNLQRLLEDIHRENVNALEYARLCM